MPIGRRINTQNAKSSLKEVSMNKSLEIDQGNNPKTINQSNEQFLEPINPKYTFEDLILDRNLKSQIMDVIILKEKSEQIFYDWGLIETHKYSHKFGINLYGDPGTGKTMAAHAIAHYLERKILIVNYSQIESKYVGETPKNITKAFETAINTNSILFFDEADAILSKRVTNMEHATDVSVNQTRSVLLMLLNDYQDIVLFATNFVSNYDEAFMRRILAHIYFPLPRYNERTQIWRKLVPDKLPNNLNITKIASSYDGISGSDISNAVLIAALKGARDGKNFVDHKYFEESITSILESKKANRGSSKNIRVENRIVSEDYALNQISK